MNFGEALPDLKFTDALSGEKAIQGITNTWVQKENACIVHFVYYSSYVLMEQDEEYLRSMLLADYILIDGIGMQTYCRKLLGYTPHNLNGTDLGPQWIKYLSEQQIPVCLYGTTPENIEKAAAEITGRYGKASIYTFQDGFSPLEWDKIPEKAALLVGMGTPKQENWVRENIATITKKKLLVITLGGFFDFMSGYYIRAPKWVRKVKLEWAWRTMLHPGRHMQKRLRDTTILYKPRQDMKKGYDRLFRFNKLS